MDLRGVPALLHVDLWRHLGTNSMGYACGSLPVFDPCEGLRTRNNVKLGQQLHHRTYHTSNDSRHRVRNLRKQD